MIRRLSFAAVLTLSVLWVVAPATIADQPSTQAGGNPCKGISNAYAHAAEPALPALTAVAEKLDCDLSGVERVAKPGHEPKNNPEDNDPEANENGGQAESPNAEEKCDRIADKLSEAQARPHGKSADAFGRQAERWGCESN